METRTRSQKPDGRLFAEDGAGTWVSNKKYKTRKGAEALMTSIMRRYDKRSGITYRVSQDRYGDYRVEAISNKWLNVPNPWATR